MRIAGTEAVADVTAAPDSSTPDDRAAAEDYPTMDDVTGEMRRVTLRVVEQVKERAEEAASMNGVSLNSWLSQAVQGALRDQMRKDRPF